MTTTRVDELKALPVGGTFEVEDTKRGFDPVVIVKGVGCYFIKHAIYITEEEVLNMADLMLA